MRATDFSAIIVGAGKGERFGGEIPKQFREIAGKPMIFWSVVAFVSVENVKEIVVLVPDGYEVFTRDMLEGVCGEKKLFISKGGFCRTDSVRIGIELSECPFVLIHDAARPMIKEKTINAVIEATIIHKAAIPVVMACDAVKILRDTVVESSLDRKTVALSQTPQGFAKELIYRALQQEGSFFDEAEVMEKYGLIVHTVLGSRDNMKITYPEDLELAEKLQKSKNSSDIIRSGIGYDIHPISPSRRLILGGVDIDAEFGLEGHSDADLVCHSVADAMLGAAGMDDIGSIFPASDMRYKDACSLNLLKRVVKSVQNRGWKIIWVDVVLTAQKPKLSPYISAIKRNINSVFEEPEEIVSIKVKSGEGIGVIGRGEGMACWAVATLKRG